MPALYTICWVNLLLLVAVREDPRGNAIVRLRVGAEAATTDFSFPAVGGLYCREYLEDPGFSISVNCENRKNG